MITLEEALERILAAVRPLPSEDVPLDGALGRFLAAPTTSPVDLPPADNSAMDGYAVRAEDVARAGEQHPVALELAGETRAGGAKPRPVAPGTCARIFTGAVLPPGADAVAMQEDVQRTPGPPVKIIFSEPVRPWENVRLRGEVVKQKAPLAEAGDEVTAQRLALLAAAGLSGVAAGRRPVAGLLATGDELREAGAALPPGAIYESNRVALAALARQAGAIPKAYPLAPDDLQLTQRALAAAFDECDIVVTTGGVSVGEMDWVKRAFAEMGGELDFWKLSIRPGKPFAFGRRGGKLLFGLPGNPVSAFVVFYLLARPALLRLQGARDLQPPVSHGRLAEALDNPGARRHFVRVILDANGMVRSAGPQASHHLVSMARANGLLDVPPGASWPEGRTVAVLRWTA